MKRGKEGSEGRGRGWMRQAGRWRAGGQRGKRRVEEKGVWKMGKGRKNGGRWWKRNGGKKEEEEGWGERRRGERR